MGKIHLIKQIDIVAIYTKATGHPPKLPKPYITTQLRSKKPPIAKQDKP